MPTNLAGGSTTTIPVTVTYNDGSTEEVQESIFTKADKRELITAKNHLDDPVSTDGKSQVQLRSTIMQCIMRNNKSMLRNRSATSD